MGFFSRKQKQIALSTPKESLEKAYHISEQNLKGHKFINTNGKEGLPIYIVNNENQKFIFSKTYKEVDM